MRGGREEGEEGTEERARTGKEEGEGRREGKGEGEGKGREGAREGTEECASEGSEGGQGVRLHFREMVAVVLRLSQRLRWQHVSRPARYPIMSACEPLDNGTIHRVISRATRRYGIPSRVSRRSDPTRYGVCLAWLQQVATALCSLCELSSLAHAHRTHVLHPP